ncbi:MAG: carbamoyl-phosphate synthase large subunit, partial [Alphaproteobacteria bacterium]|nr:carbamoyl-phosphate synthase large subunit [Alphaproteobacteria bacterium]
YSGAQACKALKAEGYRIVLVNSNPATIMTDPELADATYIEPITPEMVEKIIVRERPDALLPTMGGQTALNTAMTLARAGVLERYRVEMIGATAEAIAKAEDRQLFRQAMDHVGLASPSSRLVGSLDEAFQALDEVGMPAIIRPSFTLGGTGGGIAYNVREFEDVVRGGLRASPVGQVLIEESVLGWKEYEMEVVRDRADNCIIVCSIENVDPMGIHTGDSVCVAPALTLTDKEYQLMRNAAIAVLREIGVDTGGSNVQFAVNPQDGRLVVIEMNPRVSRSSALASKATGFPIAKVAARLAVGYTLDELANEITRITPASFEPTIDYIVTKMPRFTFEKFPGTEPELTISMKSVGEAMAIGRSFGESVHKALRSMETGLTGFDEVAIEGIESAGKDAVKAALSRPAPDRLLLIAQAFRHGLTTPEIHAACHFEPWFIERIGEIVEIEEQVRHTGLPHDRSGLLRLKQMGFSDGRLAKLTGLDEEAVSARRRNLKLHPVYKRIDTCAAEFPSLTPYLYSCYEGDGFDQPECEAEPSDRQKVVILGGGPNRIGQGIEFDYCCVHAAYSLSEAGVETIMVNCNPETVSTDYDTSDRLYFEPLTAEDVIEIVRVERQRGDLLGVIVQFGGQTPLKLATALERVEIPILGTSPDAIDLAEDRQRFQQLLSRLGLRQPENGTANSAVEAEAVAMRIGYPVVIRPSYVLGGRAMEIVHDAAGLNRYMRQAVSVSGTSPVLIDRYLQDAIEVDVDAVSDGRRIEVAGIMEHIEEAGIHSGDSACSLPPYSLDETTINEIERQTGALARALGVVGLMNVQFAVKDGDIYVLEVNPRASRTVPFVAKATGVPIAKLAARALIGRQLDDLSSTFSFPALSAPQAMRPPGCATEGPSDENPGVARGWHEPGGWLVARKPGGGSGMAGERKHRGGHVAVKEAVFPFARFPGVDLILGPEMKSTGEVMGLDLDFGRAFAKSQLGSGTRLPLEGCVFVSVRDRDKTALIEPCRRLVEMGFSLAATEGTATALSGAGLPVSRVNKVRDGRPHIVDHMLSGAVQLVFNTTEGAQAIADSFSLRRTALTHAIPYYTTVAGARAAVQAIAALRAGSLEVAPLQSYL